MHDLLFADLGSGHGCEGVGGSENRLVVNHWLRSHHWYPTHLTHLGRDLKRETEKQNKNEKQRKTARPKREHEMGFYSSTKA